MSEDIIENRTVNTEYGIVQHLNEHVEITRDVP